VKKEDTQRAFFLGHCEYYGNSPFLFVIIPQNRGCINVQNDEISCVIRHDLSREAVIAVRGVHRLPFCDKRGRLFWKNVAKQSGFLTVTKRMIFDCKIPRIVISAQFEVLLHILPLNALTKGLLFVFLMKSRGHHISL
jgi:hypothetical protein